MVILILVVALASIAGAYYFGMKYYLAVNPQHRNVFFSLPTISPTSTPIPTINWKTYINTKYGFTIQYPPNVQPIEPITAPGQHNASATSDSINLSITTTEKKEGIITIDTWLTPKDQFDQPGKTVRIGSVDATYFDLGTKEGKFDIYQLQDKSKNSIEIRVINAQLDEELFNTILSTFKFTN